MLKEIQYDIIHDSQNQYRIILDGFAQPGIVNYFEKEDLNPPKPANKAMANIAMALLNSDTSVFVDSFFGSFIEYLQLNTSVPNKSVDEAEFIFLHGNSIPDYISTCNKGELLYPEKGSTIIILVDSLNSDTQENITLILKGPGIKTERHLKISGISPQIIDAIKEANSSFPLGNEIIITDKNNGFVAIPRSSKIEIA
jgi:phosphonate C-P lyase system protein PhnH